MKIKMAEKIIYMSRDEFIRKILAGERDFSGLELEEEADLYSGEVGIELRKYLHKQDFRTNPINISGSKFIDIKAPALYLRHIKAENAIFNGADLNNTDFSYANLKNVNFNRACLANADLMRANLENANLYRTDFEEANLRGARNLEKATNLCTANFFNTAVTSKGREIIQKALRKRPSFRV